MELSFSSRRVRTVACVSAAVAVVVATLPGRFAAAAPPQEPPVVSSDYFHVSSHAHQWDGGVLRDGLLWAASCKSGKQRVSFTKTVHVPAQPTSVQVNLSAAGYTRKLLVKLDGTTLVRGVGPSRTFSGDLDVEQLARFAGGEHTLKIVAVKKKTTAGAPQCGVSLDMRGYFTPDVGVEDKPAELFWEKPFAVVFGTFTVYNDGPSGSPGGVFSASFNNATGAHVMSASPPFDGADCRSAPAGVDCRYGAQAFPANQRYFQPGQSATIVVRFIFQKPDESANYQYGPATPIWKFSADGDRNLANNSGSTTIYVCGVDDPPPECDGQAPDDSEDNEV